MADCKYCEKIKELATADRIAQALCGHDNYCKMDHCDGCAKKFPYLEQANAVLKYFTEGMETNADQAGEQEAVSEELEGDPQGDSGQG